MKGDRDCPHNAGIKYFRNDFMVNLFRSYFFSLPIPQTISSFAPSNQLFTKLLPIFAFQYKQIKKLYPGIAWSHLIDHIIDFPQIPHCLLIPRHLYLPHLISRLQFRPPLPQLQDLLSGEVSLFGFFGSGAVLVAEVAHALVVGLLAHL